MNINSPHFTIVTVSYNCEHFIEKTIKSVVSQKFKDYEYIIVDGASNDSTLSIIEQYKHCVTTFISEPDKGIFDAMNKAIMLAKGEWVVFLNAGDVFCSDMILSTVSKHTSTTSSGVVYGDIEIVKNAGLVVKRAKDPCNMHRMYFCHQSAFTRCEILKQNNYDLQYRLSADFDLYKKLYKNGIRFTHIDIPVAIYDMTGLSNSRRLEALIENLKVVLKSDVGIERLKFASKLLFVIIRIKISTLLKLIYNPKRRPCQNKDIHP